jgi:hypothetical protein
MSESAKFVTGPRERGDPATVESVADILERELQSVITDWLARVEQEPDLTCIPMKRRCPQTNSGVARADFAI